MLDKCIAINERPEELGRWRSSDFSPSKSSSTANQRRGAKKVIAIILPPSRDSFVSSASVLVLIPSPTTKA